VSCAERHLINDALYQTGWLPAWWVNQQRDRQRTDGSLAAEARPVWHDAERHDGATVGAKLRFGSNCPIAGYISEQRLAPNAPPLFGGAQPLFLRSDDVARFAAARAVRSLMGGRPFTVAGRSITAFGEVANSLNVRNVPYGVGPRGLVQGATDSPLPLLPSAGLLVEF
jgi:hypothetical protein